MATKTSVVFSCDWCGTERETRLPEYGPADSPASAMTCEDCAQKFTIADLAKRLTPGLMGTVKRLFK